MAGPTIGVASGLIGTLLVVFVIQSLMILISVVTKRHVGTDVTYFKRICVTRLGAWNLVIGVLHFFALLVTLVYTTLYIRPTSSGCNPTLFILQLIFTTLLFYAYTIPFVHVVLEFGCASVSKAKCVAVYTMLIAVPIITILSMLGSQVVVEYKQYLPVPTKYGQNTVVSELECHATVMGIAMRSVSPIWFFIVTSVLAIYSREMKKKPEFSRLSVVCNKYYTSVQRGVCVQTPLYLFIYEIAEIVAHSVDESRLALYEDIFLLCSVILLSVLYLLSSAIPLITPLYFRDLQPCRDTYGPFITHVIYDAIQSNIESEIQFDLNIEAPSFSIEDEDDGDEDYTISDAVSPIRIKSLSAQIRESEILENRNPSEQKYVHSGDINARLTTACTAFKSVCVPLIAKRKHKGEFEFNSAKFVERCREYERMPEIELVVYCCNRYVELQRMTDLETILMLQFPRMDVESDQARQITSFCAKDVLDIIADINSFCVSLDTAHDYIMTVYIGTFLVDLRKEVAGISNFCNDDYVCLIRKIMDFMEKVRDDVFTTLGVNDSLYWLE